MENEFYNPPSLILFPPPPPNCPILLPLPGTCRCVAALSVSGSTSNFVVDGDEGKGCVAGDSEVGDGVVVDDGEGDGELDDGEDASTWDVLPSSGTGFGCGGGGVKIENV